MASTKIIEITQTVGQSIDYICNPEKTDDGILVTAYACSEHTAELDFEFTRKSNNANNANLARHCIQSFAPGEISAEDAHQLGLRLAAELTKGEYEYILATHTDCNHIHNHLIINEVNFVNGKSFSSEHDQFKNPAWKQLRSISDMLCEEYNLSVIRNPERGFSRSYYEWEQSKNKQSWKDKLRETIDDCVMLSDSFEDFLKKMQEQKYEYKFRGETLSFRAEGQERFTRCRRKTLGWYYEPEQLKTRIARSVRRRAAPIQNRNGFVEVRNTENENNIGLQRWAMLKNMQEASELINIMTDLNCHNGDELKERIMSKHESRHLTVHKIKDIEQKVTEKSLLLKNINNYWKCKPVNDKYKTATNKEKFYAQHKAEIDLFRTSKKELKKLYDGNTLPNKESLEREIQRLLEEKDKLTVAYKGHKSDIDFLEKTLTKFEAYISLEKEKNVKSKAPDELE